MRYNGAQSLAKKTRSRLPPTLTKTPFQPQAPGVTFAEDGAGLVAVEGAQEEAEPQVLVVPEAVDGVGRRALTATLHPPP